MNFHELPAVKQFHDDHSRYLAIADLDQSRSARPPIAPKVTEDYRVALIGSRGASALHSAVKWSWQLLKDTCAFEATEQLQCAMSHVEGGELDRAMDLLEDAARSIVLDIEYPNLSLREVSSVAWLVCELLDLRERLIVRCANDYFEPVFISIGRDRWAQLSSGTGSVSDFVPLLADIFFTYGEVLGGPNDATASGIHGLLEAEDVKCFDLAGLAIASWSATHGHLPSLHDPILALVNSWRVGRKNAAEADSTAVGNMGT